MGLTRKDFQTLAEDRLADAQTLLKTQSNWSGAYYISGYAVECALKACICKTIQAEQWHDEPDWSKKLFIHGLEKLSRLARISDELTSSAPAAVQKNWGITKDWTEQSRYETYVQQDAEKLVGAISDVREGVMAWLRQRW